ncbi:MAG: PAS domain-containing protein, partial [Gammaproteobacteria bacterium]
MERAGLAVVAFIAITILFAWLSPAFASLLPQGWDLMKVNTAVGMLLAALGLWTSGTMASLRASASLMFGAVLSLLALLILLEHFAGIHLRMDTWLAADAASPNPGLTSGRTAVGLLLISLVIPCVRDRRGALSVAADALTFSLVGFVLILLSGYLYGAARLVGESSLILVSPQTLACFMLLTFVAVLQRTERGWLSRQFKGSRVGWVVAVSAPLVIALIYTTGFFYIYVRQNALLSRSDGVALSVTALSMVVLYVILLMAGRINRLEQSVRDLMLGKSRAELQESERRYAELVDQALEGISVRKPGGEFLFVNDTFCRMLGYTRAELLQMGIRDVVHPEDGETIEQVQRLNSGASMHLEKRMRRKNGGIVHVEVSARRLQDGNLQSTIQDVSERRRGEERFRAMVEGAPNAMVMVDEQGMITLANPQTEKLFGYRVGELLSHPVEMLIPARFHSKHPTLRAGYNSNPQMRAMGVGRDLY